MRTNTLCNPLLIDNTAVTGTFGMKIKSREFVAFHQYRMGFNGMEKDDEVKGNGDSYDFGARIYDTRLGRWLAVDQLYMKYPDLSSYSFVANCPMFFVDKDGKQIIVHYADSDGKAQTIVIKNISQLEVLSKSENNFVRAVADNLKTANDYGIKGIKKAINRKEEVNIIYKEQDGRRQSNIFISKDVPTNETKTNVIFFDPEYSSVIISNEAKEKLTTINDAINRLGTNAPEDVLNNLKKERASIIENLEDLGVVSPDEVITHELSHFLNFVRDPIGYFQRSNRADKKYDNKEEKKTQKGDEFKLRKAKGLKGRPNHGTVPEKAKRTELKIGAGGKNE